MATWIREYNATFFLAVGSITSASFAVLLRYIFKSKCRRFSCCGLTVERDVDAELREQELELQEHANHQPTVPETKDNNV
jgi:hypothetical protein